MKPQKDEALKALRNILLKEDAIKLQQISQELTLLKQQISDKESLIRSLQPIIADLLERKIYDSKDEMAEALAPIMGEAMKRQISEAKEDIVDALYPIIGKTIRKSVAESMKRFVDSVNKKIEFALQNRFTKKRISSNIPGVTNSELILRDAMPFQTEEIFLIHKNSGILIAHVSAQKKEVTVDEELISGMLTAIRDFVAEAFKSQSEQDLDEIHYGDSKILLEIGRYFYLAVVITGIEPDGFRGEIQALSRRIHNQFHKQMRQFEGDVSQLTEVHKPLETMLNRHKFQNEYVQPKPYVKYLLVTLLFIIFVTFVSLKAPVYIAQWKFHNKIKHKLTSVVDFSQQDIRLNFSESSLEISGTVHSIRQKLQVDSILHSLPDIKRVTNRLQVKDMPVISSQILKNVRQKLSRSNLDINHIQLIVENDYLIIDGIVPDLRTKRDISYIASETDGINDIINNLTIQDQEFSIETVRDFLSNFKIFFTISDASILPASYQKLDRIMNYLSDKENIILVIQGYSDNSSDPDYNLELSENRARSVYDYFISHNFPASNLLIKSYGGKNPVASNDTKEGRSKNRRVEFNAIQKR